MKYDTSRVSNPVIDEYPGRKELLGIHTGFSIHVTPKEGTFYYRSFHGSSSWTLHGKTLVYFPMCWTDMCCFTSASHLIHVFISILFSYHTGFYVAASDKFEKKFVNVNQVWVVTWVYGLVSVCVYVSVSYFIHSTPYYIHRFASPRQPLLSFMPINILRGLVGYVMLDSQTTETCTILKLSRC